MVGLHHSEFKNPVIRWIDTRLPIFTLMQAEYGKFPTPKNFNSLWNFGAFATVMLVVMIITGIFLAMNYDPNTSHAFDSVEHIMRDVNFGWLLRYLHSNGASMFFAVVYIHTFRGLYYGSYKAPRELLWILGMVIFLLLMATAFLGYTLPWGQMSFWGATVITNLFSAIPFVGKAIVTWLWGGFSVDNPTLNRFFAFHFLLPFVICAVVFLHVWALHMTGSNNPTGVEPKTAADTVPFHPYYTAKDFLGVVIFMMVYAAFTFYFPNILGHPDNYIEGNPMVTPAHIVPEWYFLPFYAILRAVTWTITIPFTSIVLIEAKLGGVLAMFGSIAVLFALPWLDRNPVRSCNYRPVYQKFMWALVVIWILLGMAGGHAPDDHVMIFGTDLGFTWVVIAQLGMLYYFVHFLVVVPYLSKHEKTLPLPESIDADVQAKIAAKIAAIKGGNA